MNWAIVFCGLCTVTDCTRQKIGKPILALGFLAGAVMTGSRIVQGSQSWYQVLLALLPGAVLWGFALVTEGKLGRGDGDMILVLGLMLGWEPCLAVLCLACMLAAAFAGLGLIARRLRKSSRIPFAPFLLGAAALLKLISLCEGGTV